MRYIGSKTLMLHHLQSVIDECTLNVRTFVDVFAGTGVVSGFFNQRGYTVLSNDILYFSYVLNKGALEMRGPISAELRDIIAHLNHLTIDNSPWFDIRSAFIYQNYSPLDQCARMYFQCGNALKIDLIRQEIERLRGQVTDAEYYYLLSLLLNAVPGVSNITGTYGAYLKYWDSRTYNTLFLKENEVNGGNLHCKCFNLEAGELARQVEGDIILDPFAGSCTSGIAANLLGRKFIGIEQDERFVAIGWKRKQELGDANRAAQLFLRMSENPDEVQVLVNHARPSLQSLMIEKGITYMRAGESKGSILVTPGFERMGYVLLHSNGENCHLFKLKQKGCFQIWTRQSLEAHGFQPEHAAYYMVLHFDNSKEIRFSTSPKLRQGISTYRAKIRPLSDFIGLQ